MGKQVWWQDWYQGSRDGKTLEPWHKPGTRSKWLKFILILSIFFSSPCPEYPCCQAAYFPVFNPEFLEGKILFLEKPLSGLSGVRKMGDGRESLVPGPNFYRHVKDLVYKDPLTITFTQTSHEKGIKTEHWNIGKTTTGKERTVTVCKESLPTSRGPHRNRFLEVLTEILVHMTTDKKTLCAEVDTSEKTEPDLGWRLYRHSCGSRCSR